MFSDQRCTPRSRSEEDVRAEVHEWSGISFRLAVVNTQDDRWTSEVALGRDPANIRSFAAKLSLATAELNAIADKLEADATAEKGAVTGGE